MNRRGTPIYHTEVLPKVQALGARDLDLPKKCSSYIRIYQNFVPKKIYIKI